MEKPIFWRIPSLTRVVRLQLPPCCFSRLSFDCFGFLEEFNCHVKPFVEAAGPKRGVKQVSKLLVTGLLRARLYLPAEIGNRVLTRIVLSYHPFLGNDLFQKVRRLLEAHGVHLM